MKFAQMVVGGSRNIGDDIQSIAAASHLPRIDLYLDRERLSDAQGNEPICLIMNAWFMREDRWPPAKVVRPIFVGFHVAPPGRKAIAAHADYLKLHEPIGVRDWGTAEFLNSLGVKTEVTYCLTMTFPRRVKEPANGKVILVDAMDMEIP